MVWMTIFFALDHHVYTKNTLLVTKHVYILSDTIDPLLLVVNKTLPGKEKTYMYVVNIYERCSFNIFISFPSTSFSSRNVYILSVNGSLYIVSIRPLGRNDRSKAFLPLKTKRLNKRRSNQLDKSVSMEWFLNYIANRYMVWMIIFFALAYHVDTKNTLLVTKHRQVKKRHIRMYVAKPLWEVLIQNL